MARYKNFRGHGGAGVRLDKSCTSSFSLSAIIFLLSEKRPYT